MGFLEYFILQRGLILSFYGLYTFLVLIHATVVTKNLGIAGMAVISTYIQMFSYGYGFLKSWFKLNILKMKPEDAFPKHFHKS
jgi:hypothetical protein